MRKIFSVVFAIFIFALSVSCSRETQNTESKPTTKNTAETSQTAETKKPDYSPSGWNISCEKMTEEIREYIAGGPAQYDETLNESAESFYSSVSSYGCESWPAFRSKVEAKIDEYTTGKLMGVGYSRLKVVFKIRKEAYYTVTDATVIAV